MNPSYHREVKGFLHRIVKWAELQPDLLALALVGSHARGDANPESDIDLILLAQEPKVYLKEQDWVSHFGDPVRVIEEDWGRVTSLRVFYAGGLEVEFGLSDPGWGADSSDKKTATVIANGLIILHEKDAHLSNKMKHNQILPGSSTYDIL
jgi:predicted nucleotidyltransferase